VQVQDGCAHGFTLRADEFSGAAVAERAGGDEQLALYAIFAAFSGDAEDEGQVFVVVLHLRKHTVSSTGIGLIIQTSDCLTSLPGCV
jgi:hypothetical protein